MSVLHMKVLAMIMTTITGTILGALYQKESMK